MLVLICKKKKEKIIKTKQNWIKIEIKNMFFLLFDSVNFFKRLFFSLAKFLKAKKNFLFIIFNDFFYTNTQRKYFMSNF